MPSSAVPPPPPAELQIVRESRLDQLGMVNELVKQYFDPLNDAVKKTLKTKGVKHAVADHFEGKLVDASPESIDPGKFLKLYEDGRLKRHELLKCLSIHKKAATEFLSGKEISAISKPLAPFCALYVTRIKGVEIELVDAVKSIAAAVA